MRSRLAFYGLRCLFLAWAMLPLMPAALAAETPASNADETAADTPAPVAGSATADTAPADGQATPPDTDPAPAADAFIVPPEEAARLRSIREEKGFIPEDDEKADDRTDQAPQTAPAEQAFVDRTEAKPLNNAIRNFLESRYGRENCSEPQWCDNLVRLRCLNKGDGPIYFYDNTTGNMLMTCGRACLNPDPFDKRDCKACPYPQWVECREKAWKEKQAYIHRKEIAELKRIEAEEKARQEKIDAILKKIEAIELECDARIHELEKEINRIE